ncbi:serine/threonine protein kinase, partial [Streptomyces sp. Wh19]|nr:serine/threonine protein kinase [Streptomyces sp. Wh19]
VRRRTGAREAIRRRPRVASAVAGTVAFIAAVYLGMALFSPDSGPADTPETGSTATTGPGQSGSSAPLPPAGDEEEDEED